MARETSSVVYPQIKESLLAFANDEQSTLNKNLIDQILIALTAETMINLLQEHPSKAMTALQQLITNYEQSLNKIDTVIKAHKELQADYERMKDKNKELKKKVAE